MANITIIPPTGGRIEKQAEQHQIDATLNAIQRHYTDPLPPASEIFIDGQSLFIQITERGQVSAKPLPLIMGANRMAVLLSTLRQLFPAEFNLADIAITNN